MREVIGSWRGELGAVREGLKLALESFGPRTLLGVLARSGRRPAEEAPPCVLCGRGTPPGREAFRVADLVACRSCQGEA